MITHIAGGVLLTLTVFLWIGLVANLSTMHRSDPAGRGLAQAYALFTIVALYLMLGVLLFFAGWKGAMLPLEQLISFLWHPISGGACVYALYLMRSPAVRWPVIIPAIVPLPLFATAIRAYMR